MFHLTAMWLAIVAVSYCVGHARGWRKRDRLSPQQSQLTEKS